MLTCLSTSKQIQTIYLFITKPSQSCKYIVMYSCTIIFRDRDISIIYANIAECLENMLYNTIQ